MIRVAGFSKESITDGTGIRYVVFTQGCKHGCIGCHNPDTHDMDGGSLFKVETIVNEIKSMDYLDGVTLSGGDPMFQTEGCLKLIQSIKEETGLNIWIYTGFKFETLLKSKDNNVQKILELVDVIVDGPFVKEKRDLSLRFRGSTNQRVIDVKESLKTGEIKVMNIDEERY